MIELIIAAGIIGAILLVMAFALKDEHTPLKIFLFFVVLNLLPLMSSSVLSSESCQPVINSSLAYEINETHETPPEEDATLLTTYTYTPYCQKTENPIAESLFNLSSRALYLSYAYIVLYIIYWFFFLRIGNIITIEGGFFKVKRK